MPRLEGWRAKVAPKRAKSVWPCAPRGCEWSSPEASPQDLQSAKGPQVWRWPRSGWEAPVEGSGLNMPNDDPNVPRTETTGTAVRPVPTACGTNAPSRWAKRVKVPPAVSRGPPARTFRVSAGPERAVAGALTATSLWRGEQGRPQRSRSMRTPDGRGWRPPPSAFRMGFLKDHRLRLLPLPSYR